MRRGRHLRPSRSSQAGLPGPLRAAASRAGERRHLHQRRRARSTATRPWATWPISSPAACWPTLPGELAIGHTRYSTAGDTVLLNAQPFSVACNKGQIAVAHNGNITNAAELRARPGAPRLDLPGVQRYRSHPAPGGALLASARWPARCAMRCCNSKARFRWCFWPGSHHRGARPARLPSAGDGRDGSLGRPQVLRLRLGNLRLRSDRRGLSARRRARRDGDRRSRRRDARALRARAGRARSASSSTSISRVPIPSSSAGRWQESREKLGRLLARECPADADLVVPVPDSGVAAAIGYSAESGLPFRQALIRNHYVGRTFIEPSQAIRDFGVKLKLNPVRHLLRRQARGAGGRFHRARHHQPQDRPHGAAGRRARSAPAHLLPADDFALFLRRRYADAQRTDRGQSQYRGDPPIRGSRFAGLLSLGSLRKAVGDENHEYCYACYTGDYPTELVNIEQLVSTRKKSRIGLLQVTAHRR